MITTQQLKCRGWTSSSINKFLITPDLSNSNVNYYDVDRVIAIENSNEFQYWYKNSKYSETQRKDINRQRVNKMKEDTINHATSLEIIIPLMDKAELIYKSYKHYAALHGYEIVHDTNPEFIQRICINFLRHTLPNYDTELDKMAHRIGKDDAHEILKNKINNKITETYPWLKEWVYGF